MIDDDDVIAQRFRTRKLGSGKERWVSRWRSAARYFWWPHLNEMDREPLVFWCCGPCLLRLKSLFIYIYSFMIVEVQAAWRGRRDLKIGWEPSCLESARSRVT